MSSGVAALPIEKAHAYVPMDRRVALMTGRELPAVVRGTALEADLSGFTVLTESLARELGEQRGAEELARRLNVMYDALLHEVHRFGGTVLNFSGDAFTTWLDGDDGARAVACAIALQQRIGELVPWAHGSAPPRLKVALATGCASRFLVGDPAVQVLEGIAGSLVDEMAAVEHEAQPGEIVLAASTRASLGARVTVGDRGVLLTFGGAVEDSPWPPLNEEPSDVGAVRPWLFPEVFARLAAGHGDFVAELRPVTAMFIRFLGIRFDTRSESIAQLDAYVRSVQGVMRQFGGTLLQLTVGDKGSYLYATFGAPVAHEDDPARALLAALALRRLRGPAGPPSIGIAAGRLRAGSYGGSERRTYGVIGDTVNLAARLMQAAGPGEVIATREVKELTAPGFSWTRVPHLTVKGKADPVPVAKLRGTRSAVPHVGRGRIALAGAMLGRGVELAELRARLARAARGNGQVVAVTAEAGMGKTRLVSEFLRQTRDGEVTVIRSECPSYGVNGSYVVWLPIWQRLFGLSGQSSPAKRIARVAEQLRRADPAMVPRVPLLAPLLALRIPDTDLTRSLDAKVRKASLEAMLADWLRKTVARPTLLVLEDCHWIDALSEDLLEVVCRAARELPLLIIVTMRPRDASEGGPLAITRQPHFSEVALGRLSDRDVRDLIRQRLERTELPPSSADAVGRLAQRAEGNPFYVGELVDYVVDLGAAALDPARLAELPSSLQSLVLSRIDRLEEQPRATLRVASAVGRVFQSALLPLVQPDLGGDPEVRANLGVLERSDFVLPEHTGDAYEFKHAITQEAAYSTMVGAVRSALHGRIGRVLEARAGDDLERQLDLLAHHFGQSDDDERRRVYVLRAADAARARYANRAAIEYYRNVLPLLVGSEREEVLLNIGRALGLAGRWEEAAAAFGEARDRAVERSDPGSQAWAETELGELLRKRGLYAEALQTFENARAAMVAAGDEAGVAEVLHYEGTLAAQQQDTDAARTRYQQSLEIRRRLGDRRAMTRSMNGLGIVAEYENDLRAAAAIYEETLGILVELDDRWHIAALTNNAGYALLLQGKAAEARPLFERAVALEREIGDPHMLANFLSNLGDAARDLGDFDSAMRWYEESLVLARDLGERWLIAYLLEDVGVLAAEQRRPARALRLVAAGAQLRREIGAPLPAESQRQLDRRLESARRALGESRVASAIARGAAIRMEQAIDEALQR